ncbi:MAG: Peptide deformylase [Candidatus Yanofskybacteria bacterium GW2011_GWC2_41_9]|uniref:Peptide deformylase n=1 Tax=Candidatus Yanofskybacteria bacterium GW2011_GWC2_41_9 TaxID=1619029 RepID=A0A0G0XR43_9BACT|nr:MAG: Peptide deformylase [Candidatus Yanofskybacteria bacterium GW2011_GWC2_41_9]
MEIVKLPNKILRHKATSVSAEEIKNGSAKKLISAMRENMKKNNGVGLAANQVGSELNIFVIDPELAKTNNVPDAFTNPEITSRSRECDELEDPEYYASISRSKKIQIKALDENGNKIKFKARGFLARVLQHEADHLNGIVIKDKK